LHEYDISHDWRVVKDTGMHHYECCDFCEKRNIRRVMSGGHQPRDLHWLETGEWQEMGPPPRGIKSAAKPPEPTKPAVSIYIHELSTLRVDQCLNVVGRVSNGTSKGLAEGNEPDA
jgi:hypothetical protein